MQVLFIHQGFPAQFASHASGLLAEGHCVHAIGTTGSHSVVDGCEVHLYEGPDPLQLSDSVCDPVLECNLIRAARVAERAEALKASGLNPEVVVFHSAWGEGLYLRDIWPEAVLIAYPELYGQAELLDIDDPDAPPVTQTQLRFLRRNNLMALAALADSDAAFTPTLYQRSTFPSAWRSRIQVIHEGVNSRYSRPDSERRIRLNDGLILNCDDMVLTFVSRSLEPLRGYCRFMRALPYLFRNHPRLQVVIVGGDGTSYSPPCLNPGGYTAAMREELGEHLDWNRLHIMGVIKHEQLVALLQVSTVHAYLSYPYILSWSLIEAMACGAVVVASNTEPVREVIRDGENGLLVSLNNPARIAERISEVLRNPQEHQRLGVAARQTVLERFRHDQGMQSFQQWINSLVLLKKARRRP
ncbi:glycosyltransferase [Synechococcus sp. J7-Johnson]|uniref:glycosyltransferase n=1 Tax=Synechococcus sp. J7-Johnson TaxID=2823737 RepID=UPI0020CE8C41|nr:glycosyltransferase [Synechococcus sp. J7-Johnson]MCP9839603.1 glycosyltransferase [Synechococcus sp. J7-Johnson]